MTRGRRLPRFALGVVLGAVVACAAPCDAATEVTLIASDGTRLSGSWTPPPARAPAVLLLHMLTRSHRDWDRLSGALSTAGFGVLALDLRGHGASGGSRADLKGMVEDVRAALAWLDARPDVVPARIGICGASLGSALAMLAAGSHPSVRSMVLLSPAFDYRGLRAAAGWRQFDARGGAALLVAANGDPYAVRCAREAAESTRGARALRILEADSAHGTLLLDRRPDLIWPLVDWFRTTLL